MKLTARATELAAALLLATPAAFAATCDGATGKGLDECLAKAKRPPAVVPDLNSKEDAPGQPTTAPAVPRGATPRPKRIRTQPPAVPSELSRETAPGQPPAAQPVRKSQGPGVPLGSKAGAATPSTFGPESSPGQAPSPPPRTQ